MKISTLLFLLCFPIYIGISQVGIGTISPNSLLDIKSSSLSNPSNKDGILIPKVDKFPVLNPGINQNGMLIFLTVPRGTDDKGFYYWDNPNTKWVNIGAEEWKAGINVKGDKLIYATRAKLTGTDVVITDDGRVGFGTSDPIERFEFKGPGDNDFQITSANTNPPNYILYNTGGTLESPTILANNGEIGSFIVKTHDGTNIVETGGFRFFMDGQASLGSAPSRFVINTTPVGSVDQVERIIVRSTGNVGLSTPDPTQRLDVNGNARIRTLTAGSVYSMADGTLTNSPTGPVTFAAGKVNALGAALKITGATVTRPGAGVFQVTFIQARSSANYIIQLSVLNCISCGTDDSIGIYYSNQDANGFRVIMGANDNGATVKVPVNLEFMFTAIDF